MTGRSFLTQPRRQNMMRGSQDQNSEESQMAQEREWADRADVVVIGAGATGLPAAIAACENGASVLLIEANFDVGGHAAISGGNVPLGGGTSAQKAAGIEDSPDLLFADLTELSVVQPT